jgi:hypothetical protein
MIWEDLSRRAEYSMGSRALYQRRKGGTSPVNICK